VAGYNIYRSGTTGGPYAKLDASTDASTSYTDSSVQAGQTYYYVTTSVGVDGIESAYSSQVSAVIPTP
jgi:fibronectin type 3 domain-containing protein